MRAASGAAVAVSLVSVACTSTAAVVCTLLVMVSMSAGLLAPPLSVLLPEPSQHVCTTRPLHSLNRSCSLCQVLNRQYGAAHGPELVSDVRDVVSDQLATAYCVQALRLPRYVSRRQLLRPSLKWMQPLLPWVLVNVSWSQKPAAATWNRVPGSPHSLLSFLLLAWMESQVCSLEEALC